MDALIPKRDRLRRNHHHREQTTPLARSRPCLMLLSSVRGCRGRPNRDLGKTSELLIAPVYVAQKQTHRQVMVLLLIWLFGSISKGLPAVISKQNGALTTTKSFVSASPSFVSARNPYQIFTAIDLMRVSSSVGLVVENQKRHSPPRQDAELDNQDRLVIGTAA